MLTPGFGIWVRSPAGSRPNPNNLAATTIGESCQIAVASKETSTTLGSPVRSRFTSAAEMAPAMARPPITSPKAGDG